MTRLADQLASVTRLARRRVQAIALTGLDARTTTANPAATEARPALGGVAPAVAAWFGQAKLTGFVLRLGLGRTSVSPSPKP